LAHTSIDMSAATRRKLAAAFADSNRLVMSRYALPEFPSMRLRDAGSISEATDQPSLETVFSTTTLGRVEGTEVIPTPGDRT